MSAVACARGGKKEGEDPKGVEVNSAINQERMGVFLLCTCVVSEAKRFSISTVSSALAAGEQEQKYESRLYVYLFVFLLCFGFVVVPSKATVAARRARLVSHLLLAFISLLCLVLLHAHT